MRAWFLQWGHTKLRVFSFKRLTCSHHSALAGPICSILCSDRSLLVAFLFSWSQLCRHAALPSVVDSASLVTSQKIRWPRGPSRRADEFLNISRCCCCDRLFFYMKDVCPVVLKSKSFYFITSFRVYLKKNWFTADQSLPFDIRVIKFNFHFAS